MSFARTYTDQKSGKTSAPNSHRISQNILQRSSHARVGRKEGRFQNIADQSIGVRKLAKFQDVVDQSRQANVLAQFMAINQSHKPWASGDQQLSNLEFKNDLSTPPVQLAAINLFPKTHYRAFEPKYKVWRDTYWNQKIVYGTHTMGEIMGLINNADATHVGADGTHKNKNNEFTGERTNLNLLMTTARNYESEERESLNALDDLQDFVVALDTFLDKWEDSYDTAEKQEKGRLAEILVKVTTQGDLDIHWFDQVQYSSRTEQYKETLKAKILADRRLIATLRGKDSFKLHLRDDDPKEVAGAIDRAVDKLRTDHNLDARIKPTADTEWSAWRKNDCVFAAIIYVMNNDTAKYTNVLGQNPAILNAENAEKGESKGIANKLGIGYGVVEDPVIFNIMKRLGWSYTANETWNSWVVGNKYTGGSTYIISYSRSQTGDANHTVVFKDGDVYDRQGQRLGGAVDLEPNYKDQPMEIWEVDTVAAGIILN